MSNSPYRKFCPRPSSFIYDLFCDDYIFCWEHVCVCVNDHDLIQNLYKVVCLLHNLEYILKTRFYPISFIKWTKTLGVFQN